MIWISLGLTLVGLIISLLLPKLTRMKDFLSFILTMLATLVGVYVAVVLADVTAKRDRKEKAVKMIEVTLAYFTRYDNYQIPYKTTILPDGTAGPLTIDLHPWWKRNQTLPFPDIASFLKNENVMATFSNETIQSLTDDQSSANRVLQTLSGDKDLENISFKENLDRLIFYGRQIELKLSWEEDYQKGTTTLAQLKSKYKDNSDQILRNWSLAIGMEKNKIDSTNLALAREEKVHHPSNLRWEAPTRMSTPASAPASHGRPRPLKKN